MKLLLDCDGILADFHSTYLGLINSYTGKSYVLDDIKDFSIEDSLDVREYSDRIKNDFDVHDLCEYLEPILGSEEAVEYLNSKINVVIVTAPFSSYKWVNQRYNWLRWNYNIDASNIIFTKNKTHINGDYFIDDSLDNCVKWAVTHTQNICMLWDRPWNRKNRVRLPDNLKIIDNWDDVYKQIGI